MVLFSLISWFYIVDFGVYEDRLIVKMTGFSACARVCRVGRGVGVLR